MANQLGRITDPDLALAARLHSLANALEAFPHLDGYRDCGCIRCRAETYAAVGYPSSTIGDGGSRGADGTSSTERAAIIAQMGRSLFADLGTDFRVAIDSLDSRLSVIEQVVSVVLAHGSDEDPIPSGQGPCYIKPCGHTCNPRKNPEDRRRAGLCPACHQSMLRYQRRNPGSTRQEFIAWRTKALAGDRTHPKVQVVA